MQDDIQDKVEHNPYHDVDAQDIRDVGQRTRITHEELPAPHLVSKHIIIPERDDHTQCRDTQQGIGEYFSNYSSYLSSA